jgi:hypothetical protein
MIRADNVLAPYIRPLRRVPRIILTLAAYAALILFAMIYGYFISILPPELLFIPGTPLLILLILILWSLPDLGREPRTVSITLLSAFLAFNYIWPSYVALNLPGLPWLNPQRVVLLILLVSSVYALSTSSRMRRGMLEAARAEPRIWIAFAVYTAATTVAIPFAAENIVFSVNKWANNQVYWTFLFLMSAWFARTPGALLTMVRALMIAGIITAVIAFPEHAGRKVPWIDIIPSWLIGDPILFAVIADDQARLHLDTYRARSTFGVSLSFAEFLAIVLPFYLHAAVTVQSWVRKLLLAAGAVAIITAMAFLTDARSGMNGAIIGVFGYAAFWTFSRWRKRRHDLIAPAAMLAFPAAILSLIGLIFAWRRLYVMVIGGGQHQFSNNAREVQWEMAIDRVLANPIGYGPGRSGEVLGFLNPAGRMTVDSYPINLLLDSGVIGLLAFFAFLVATIWAGLRMALRSDDKELALGGPMAIGLFALLVIKLVLSQPENLPILFAMAGAVCGIHWRLKQGLVVSRPTAAASLAPQVELRPQLA